MERLLRYEPDKAVMLWHQIHQRRRRDQMAGKGDYSESNIVYKFLANRGLFPAISEASGEYIAKQAKPEASDGAKFVYDPVENHLVLGKTGGGRGRALSSRRPHQIPQDDPEQCWPSDSSILKVTLKLSRVHESGGSVNQRYLTMKPTISSGKRLSTRFRAFGMILIHSSKSGTLKARPKSPIWAIRPR
jgi:hypothetical protein